MSETGWGIWATGWIAKEFVQDLKLAGRSVVAVGSRSTARARDFAQSYGIPAAYGSLAELVNDNQVDVLYVATPHPFHAEAALTGIAAGKAVLIEKPFTLNATQARQVAAAAQAKGVLVMEAMWTRFLPHIRKVHQVISAGGIGQVKAVLGQHLQALSEDPGHRINALELGGGALLDLGVYPISLAFDLLGTPDTIAAQATFKATGADASVATVFTYRGGQRAYTVSASDLAGPNRAVVVGQSGRLEMDSVWYTPTVMTHFDAAGQVVDQFDGRGPGRGMQYMAQHVEDLIAAGAVDSPLMPLAQSVAIMDTLDQIRSQIGLAYPSEAQATANP